ncbi:MAG: 30S ribosomal protein S17 [Candidatus Thermoplasmatota archaeon]|nr:30S ribosomal protein S17 [Candidatus Thermoplasmatota archaeon]
MAENDARDIGVDVTPPQDTCEDDDCPFHGTLSVRGQVIDGIVESTMMEDSIVVRKDYFDYIPKYERYEKRKSHYRTHLPSCIDLEEGDKVKIMECRPLSKSVSYVVIERGEEG